MNAQEYEQLKTKIDSKKNQMAKNEGMLQQIVNDWKEKHNLTTEEEVSAFLKELEENISTDTEKVEKLYNELKNIYDWNKV